MGGSRVPDPELYELTFPHRILNYELRPDSAGAGKWRGGYGALFSLRFNEDGSALSVQIGSGAEETAPFGLAGGSPAAAGTVRVRSEDGEEVEFHRAAMHHPRGGDVAEIRSAGGGGYGEPVRAAGGGRPGRRGSRAAVAWERTAPVRRGGGSGDGRRGHGSDPEAAAGRWQEGRGLGRSMMTAGPVHVIIPSRKFLS